jgi:uncharacterized protein (TIGR02996 family)
MDEEARFLCALRVDPSDPVLRLVFADWLDERGDAASRAQGEFLRLQGTLAKLKKRARGRAGMESRLQELRQVIPLERLVLLEELPVENCGPEFEFQCPRRWEKMQSTDDPRVRFCDACRKNVYHCSTAREVQHHATQGHCVAVDPRTRRHQGDLAAPDLTGLMLGRIAPPRVAGQEPPFTPRQRVNIRDGVFAGMQAVVVTWNEAAQALTVALAVFGRTCPVELEPWQVEPAD